MSDRLDSVLSFAKQAGDANPEQAVKLLSNAIKFLVGEVEAIERRHTELKAIVEKGWGNKPPTV